MESLLLELIKEAKNQKYSLLRTKAQEAYDTISMQKVKKTHSCSELRAVCTAPLTYALESKRPKLMSLSLVGLQILVTESMFQSGLEPENDNLWLPAQLLNATNSILSLSEDIQAQILKTMLAMVCGNSPENCTLNGRLVILLLNRYCETHEYGSEVIKAASQAAASQTIRTYCTILEEDYHEMIAAARLQNGIKISQYSALSCFNDAIPVLQYFCNRLEEALIFSKSNTNVGYFLECLRSLFNALPIKINKNTFFITFLWQKFCPALLSFMGLPGTIDNNNDNNLLTTTQAKIVYGIATELVRLFGNEMTLRPVLEAIFHRMLLLPKPEKRRESLKAVKDLISTSDRLKNLLLLNTVMQDDKIPIGDELSLIRLIMDSVEESAQCNDFDVILASVECIEALLVALEKLYNGDSLNDETVTEINEKYKNVSDAEYKGPLTYQSMIRLPKPYRDIVASMRCNSQESDSSGIDGGIFEPITGDCSETDNDSATDDANADANENCFKKTLFPEQKGIFGKLDVDIERHNARHFFSTLEKILLPHLVTLRSSGQTDEIIQEFASKCCQHNAAQNFEVITPISADNIYIVTISTLVFNLKLMNESYYKNKKTAQSSQSTIIAPFMDEDQFIAEIQTYGVSINLSKSWLSELYRKIIEISLLENAGYSMRKNSALVNFLIDICDLNSNRFLVDWKKLETITESVLMDPASFRSENCKLAGRKLTRKVLTCCWDSMIRVLNSSMNDSSDRKSIKSFESDFKKFDQLLTVKRMKKHSRCQKVKNSIITTCLESVQKMITLSINLEMKTEGYNFLKLIVNYATIEECVLKNREVTSANALVLDLLIKTALEFGSKNAHNWPLIFNGIEQIAKLENIIFSKNDLGLLNLNAIQRNRKLNNNSKTLIDKNENDQINENRIDVYGFLQSSSSLTDEIGCDPSSVSQLINELNYQENQSGDCLTLIESAKISSLLSAQVDEFFHMVSIKFNLPTILEFLEQLCSASQKQLFSRNSKVTEEYKRWWKADKTTSAVKTNTNSLLLHRIGSITLKCMKSGRPLIHLIRIWTTVGPHFMEAACHKDKEIARKAVSCIYDAISIFINEQQLELLYFHFNEALFKPFESLLNLVICDCEIQEQIIQCINEFVENNYLEIGSGWKSILNSLKTVDSLMYANSLLKIFNSFLNVKDSDMFVVFFVDYIMCLVSHVKRRKSLKTSPKSTTTCATSAVGVNTGTPVTSGNTLASHETQSMSMHDFQLEVLNSLSKCPEILTALFLNNKNNRSNNNTNDSGSSNVGHVSSSSSSSISDTDNSGQDNKLFDAATMSIEFIVVDPRIENDSDVLNFYAMLTTRNEIDQCYKKNIPIESNRITNCWYIYLEELVTTMFCSAHDTQLQVIEVTIKSFRDLLNCPGPNFGLYCLNTLLLPMMQGWLRQLDRFDNQSNFRHCFGQVTELYSDYFKFVHEQELIQDDKNPLLTLILKQLLLILLESFTKSDENIARLGSSCLRHLIINLGPKFCEVRWKIVSVMIHRACTLSLRPLQWLLMAKTVEISHDKSTDKSVSKKRLYQIARQIFHAKLEAGNCKCDSSNASGSNGENKVDLCSECKSENIIYKSLIRLQLENGDKHQISFSKLLVGLLIHQIIIQMLSSVLLQNLKRVIPIFDVLQINHCNLRGILNKNVTIKHIDIMLKCLEISEDKSRDFNEKIHLKTMLQKSLGFELPVNLYTQTNTSEIVQIIILIELCMDGIEQCSLTESDVEKLVDFSDNISDDDYLRLIMIKLKRKWDYLCDSINEICKNDEKRQPAVQNDKITLFGNDLFELNFEKVKPNPNSHSNTNANANANATANTAIKTESEDDSSDDYDDNDTDDTDDTKMLEIHAIKFHCEKDLEHYKSCRLETIEACLELLRTLPSSRVSPLAPILGPSAQQLKISLLNSFTNRTIYNSVNELIAILKLN